MVVQVQYEALGNQQVAIPNLLAAYAQGKEIKNRQKQFDLANRQGEIALKKEEMSLPYYKTQLEQQRKQGELAIEKYGRDKMYAMVEYAQRFIPQANSVEDLMGMLKAGEDAGLIDPEISQMVLTGIPESAINNPEEFAKIRERLLYSTQLFEHQLKLTEMETANKYRSAEQQKDFENRKTLQGMDNAAREKLYGDFYSGRGSGNGYTGSTPEIMKLISARDSMPPGPDRDAIQNMIDNKTGSGSYGGYSGRSGSIPLNQITALYETYLKARVDEMGKIIDQRPFKQWAKEETGIDLDAKKNSSNRYQAEDILTRIQDFNLSEGQIDQIFKDLESNGEMDTYYQLDSLLKESKKNSPAASQQDQKANKTIGSVDLEEDLTDKVSSNLSEALDFKYSPEKKNVAEDVVEFITFLTGKAGKDVGGILKAAAENLPEAQQWLRRNVIYPLQRFGQSPSKETKRVLEKLDQYAGGGK